jgi:hypothetical protein
VFHDIQGSKFKVQNFEFQGSRIKNHRAVLNFEL